MNRLLISLIVLASFIIAACNDEKADNSKNEQKTIEQAMLDSQIDTDNIVYTEKIEGHGAFSIYKADNSFGIIQYQKREDGWQYIGASDFGYPSSGHQEHVTFGATTWPSGDYSAEEHNIYNTLFVGEILEPDIEKVILEVDHGKYNANILTSNDRTFWYLIYQGKNPQISINKISGYSSNRELLYESYVKNPK